MKIIKDISGYSDCLKIFSHLVFRLHTINIWILLE